MRYNPIPADATEVKAKLIRKGKNQIVSKLQLLSKLYADGDPTVIEQVFGVIYDDVKMAASDMDGALAPIYQEIRNRPAPSFIPNLVSGENLEEMADVIWESMLQADPSYNDLSTPDRKFVSKRFLSYLHGSFMVDPSGYLEDYFQTKDDLQAMYDDQQQDVSEPWSQFVPTRGMSVRNRMAELGYNFGEDKRTMPSEEFYAKVKQEQTDGDVIVLFATPEFMFVDILTTKGACALGSVKWCTVSAGMSQSQKKNGVILLYVVKGGRRMQFNLTGTENKNEANVEYTRDSKDVAIFQPIMDKYERDIKAVVETRIEATNALTPVSDFLSGKNATDYDKFRAALQNIENIAPPDAYIGNAATMKLLPIGWLSIPKNRQLVTKIFNNQNLLNESNFNKLSKHIDKRILKVEFAIRRSPYICRMLQTMPNINWFMDANYTPTHVITKDGDMEKFNYKIDINARINYNMNLFALSEIPGGRHRFQHEHVWIDPFAMMRYEMTRGVYLVLMGFNAKGSWYDYDEFAKPKSEVSWYEACACANQFSTMCGFEGVYRTANGRSYTPQNAENEEDVVWDHDAEGFRLPTEAEWEIAARGGDESRAMKPDDFAGSSNPLEVAWFTENSNNRVHVVGQLKPNRYGLFDMSGNLYEWVWDTYEGEVVSYPLQDSEVRAEYEAMHGRQNPKRRR